MSQSCGSHSSPGGVPPGDSQGPHTTSRLPYLGPHGPTWGISRQPSHSHPRASRPHLGHHPGHLTGRAYFTVLLPSSQGGLPQSTVIQWLVKCLHRASLRGDAEMLYSK